MNITVTCEKCGMRLKAPASLAGQRAKCSKCGSVMQIPEVDSADTGFELQAINENPLSRRRKKKPQQPSTYEPADSTTPPAAPVSRSSRRSASAPLNLLDDLVEPELPATSLVEHNPEDFSPPSKDLELEEIQRDETGARAILARAAANSKRYHEGAPPALFSLMGVDFTLVRGVILAVAVLLFLSGGVYWFTGPGSGAYIVSAEPVTTMIALDTLVRNNGTILGGMTPGQQGVHVDPSPLGTQFHDQSYGLGGRDQLIFTRPDPGGDYILVHVKLSHSTIEAHGMENRYDAAFGAGNFMLHVDGKQIKPILIMGQLADKPLEMDTASARVDDVDKMLPKGVTPSDYQNLMGTKNDISKATLVYDGSSGVTGTVDVSSRRRLMDLPGVTGITGRGELVQQDPYSGATIKYQYTGGGLILSWSGPAKAWWSTENYVMPARNWPFSRYDVYLLYPRPQTTDSMVIKIDQRKVGTLSSSLAATGQPPSTVALGTGSTNTPASTPVGPTVFTPSTPQEAADAMAGGPGGVGGAPKTPTNPNADPHILDYYTGMAKTRVMTKGVLAENNMKQIGAAVLMYADQNQDKLPPTMDHIRTVLGDINNLLYNPRTDSNPGFLYISPASRLSEVSNPASTPILYELRDGKIDRDGAIMYLDGHIQLPKK